MAKRKKVKVQKPRVTTESFLLEEVSVAAIKPDGNHREDVGDIKALAESIRRQGLLQPVVVFRRDVREHVASYILAAGQRRLAAVKRLGWLRIPARVFPAASAEVRTAVSAIENLDRRDLTPVEEALAVARLAEHLGVKPKDLERGAGDSAALEKAAAMLGRSVPWVRQRGALLRLCPGVRALVAAGRLPLAQAREIAKLASASIQSDVAGGAIREYHRDPRSVAKEDPANSDVHVDSVRIVRAAVAEMLDTLRGVPWKADVAFAGRPACGPCPDNSANSLLFGLDPADTTDPAPEARCLNATCYRRKMVAAEEALAVTAKKLAKEKGVRATVAGVRDRSPDCLKPAKVARELERARGTKSKQKGGQDSREKVSVPWDKQPEGKLYAAEDKWTRTCKQLIAKALTAKPFGVACLFTAIETTTWCRHISWGPPKKEALAKVRPLLKHVASGQAADLTALLADVNAERIFDGGGGSWGFWATRHLGGLLNVDLPAEPKLEDFLPKPKAAKPEPAKPKAAKPETKKAAKPKAKKGRGALVRARLRGRKA